MHYDVISSFKVNLKYKVRNRSDIRAGVKAGKATAPQEAATTQTMCSECASEAQLLVNDVISVVNCCCSLLYRPIFLICEAASTSQCLDPGMHGKDSRFLVGLDAKLVGLRTQLWSRTQCKPLPSRTMNNGLAKAIPPDLFV